MQSRIAVNLSYFEISDPRRTFAIRWSGAAADSQPSNSSIGEFPPATLLCSESAVKHSVKTVTLFEHGKTPALKHCSCQCLGGF